jgi:hypothetical protein
MRHIAIHRFDSDPGPKRHAHGKDVYPIRLPNVQATVKQLLTLGPLNLSFNWSTLVFSLMPSGNLCYIPREQRLKGSVCLVTQPRRGAIVPDLPIPKLKEHKQKARAAGQHPTCGRNNAILTRLLQEESHCWICGFTVLSAPDDSNHGLRPSVDHVKQGSDSLAEMTYKLAHAWCNSRRGSADDPLTPSIIDTCQEYVLAKRTEWARIRTREILRGSLLRQPSRQQKRFGPLA